MKAIWKFVLAERCSFNMPKGAQVLSVQSQNGSGCMWVLVDPSADTEVRSFAAYCTGALIDNQPMSFIGTFQLFEGAIVLHVFEILKEVP